jgi:hypothetical protein
MGYNRTVDGTQIFASQRLTLGQSKFVEVDDGYESLALNGSSGGSVTVVWNGTGAGDTGGDWTLSDDGTETAAAMRSGTNGLDSGERTNNDKTTFTTSPAFDVEASYDSISFWMNPQLKEANTDLMVRWFNGAGSVGSLLNVENYVSNFDIGVWQKVTIPLADFNLSGGLIDNFKFVYSGQGPKKQQYYFDDIELNGVSGLGPYVYRVEADGYNVYHIDQVCLVLVTNDSGWNSDDFTNITGGLETGVIVRHFRKSDSTVLWSVVLKNNMDLFGRLTATNDATFLDSEHLMTFELNPGSAKVLVTDDDVLDIVVSDDLSSLTNFRAFVHYGIEEIS